MTGTTDETYKITGMSCSACSTRVECAVGTLPGIRSVQVNLLTGSMRVSRSNELSQQSIIAAIKSAGYGASLSCGGELSTRREGGILQERFLLSVIMLFPLMISHHLWQGTAGGMVQLLLSLPILWLNRKFFVNGFRGAMKGAANMDTLVALGAGAAMIDGLCNFYFQHRESYYFECAAMIVTLVTLGKWMESRATERTGAALEKLMALLPRTATILRDGEQIMVPADAVTPGEMVLVRPGERLPVDGIVTSGISSVSQAALTGESLPVEKIPGSKVYAGTINGNGVLEIRTEKGSTESTLSAVIALVGDAAATKPPISRLADRLSGIFVPIVVLLALLTACTWLFLGADWGFAISCAIAVLVISCPCALGLATPVAIMVGMGRGAEHGILFRNGAALEHVHRTTAIILDKTGTITSGHPIVTNILPAQAHTRDELLQLAADLECHSHHPLAKALQKATEGVTPHPADGLTYLPGRGITAWVHGVPCAAGNAALMHSLGLTPPPGDECSAAGKTSVFFAANGEFIGTVLVEDPLKPEVPAAITALRKQGLKILMITGDNALTARALAQQAGISEVYAETLPQDKEAHVRRLQAAGHIVAMVGDGINDAPALTRADVGIALGAGADIAKESADLVLVRNRLTDVVGALRLSRAVITNIRQNLFWALLYNTLAIPLAAGALYPLTGWLLQPAVAAAAMGLSSFCVVSNALRLRNFIPLPPQNMNTITIKVNGMMCPHCEAHVTKSLLALPGVIECRADHKAGLVTLTTDRDIPLEALHSTIKSQGYTVL